MTKEQLTALDSIYHDFMAMDAVELLNLIKRTDNTLAEHAPHGIFMAPVTVKTAAVWQEASGIYAQPAVSQKGLTLINGGDLQLAA